jgi:hypothetical protein
MESNMTFKESGRGCRDNDGLEFSPAKRSGSGRKDDGDKGVSNKDKIKNYFKKKLNNNK